MIIIDFFSTSFFIDRQFSFFVFILYKKNKKLGNYVSMKA